MINNKAGQIVKDVVLTITFSILYILLVWRFSSLLLMLLPIPFIVIGLRNNVHVSILAMAILFTLLNFSIDIGFALSTIVIIGPITLAIQFMIRRREGAGRTLALGALVFLITIFGLLFYEEASTGVSLIGQMDAGFENMLELQAETLRGLDMTDMELNRALALLRTSYDYIVTVMPMILLMISLMTSYLNYKIAAFLINKTEDETLEVPEFSLFALPGNFIMGTIIMFLASYVISRLEIPYHGALRQNLSFVVGFLFLVQGFSLMDYFLRKIRLGKFFRVLILVVNLALMPIGGILMILGFADSIFDFRKIRRKA